MNELRFQEITGRYAGLRIGLVGDFFLDRYLEIDPTKAEDSIETGLPVYNVVAVRAQPGAAGTILNNLVALGVGTICPVGFCGEDGEGYELRRAMNAMPGVNLDHFLTRTDRRTPVYCKPLVLEPGQPPRELNRFDSKNWSETPEALQRDLAERVAALAEEVDALILMDQVDVSETGVVTVRVARAASAALLRMPKLTILADSRRGVRGWPPMGFKMNAAELARVTEDASLEPSIEAVSARAAQLVEHTRQPVFVTLADQGIVGAVMGEAPRHVPSLPVRGPIDIVGAGDSVTANLATALAAGANLDEAMRIAMAAASIVVHQLGTTGTASVKQIRELIEM